ncbi:MAG: response regulator transcription factor [Chitinophagaceae bacterium]|nr:response regulator transcription factor [Chitinophagaceae bacterium]
MRVLIISQETKLAQSIYRHLVHENYICKIVYNVEDGKHMIGNFNFECILLDISISKDDGLNFLQEARKSKKKEGIIVLSGKKTTDEAIHSLKLGADDYMAEPLHLGELSARIEAVIKRKYLNNDTEIRFKDMAVNTLSRKVTIGNNKIGLTKAEYDILLLLLINSGRVISKEEIAERLTGQTDIYLYNFDILYTHIKNLKKKLSLLGQYIKTIYGIGYCIME